VKFQHEAVILQTEGALGFLEPVAKDFHDFGAVFAHGAGVGRVCHCELPGGCQSNGGSEACHLPHGKLSFSSSAAFLSNLPPER